MSVLPQIIYDNMTLIYWLFFLISIVTKLGCEAAIHTTRTFVNNDHNRGKVLRKLDFKNSFNSVERDCIVIGLLLYSSWSRLWLSIKALVV
jgi:hypothetical protein